MKRLLFLCLGTQVLALSGVSGAWKVDSFLGDGNPGFKGDFKKVSDAQTEKPFGVVRGPDGALWFCEYGGNRVRKVGTDGRVMTVAGTGESGFAGDGDKALKAKLNKPHEIRFDSAGDLYIADMANHSIRKVELKTGVIKTVAGTGFGGYEGDGDLATTAHLKHPSGMQFAPDGSLYICDTGNHAVRRLDVKTGVISNVAGTGKPGLTPDGASLEGTPISAPRAIDFDRDGNPWVVSRDSNLVLKLDLKSGTIKHVAGNGQKGSDGDGGPAKKASLNSPKGISIDREGSAWIVDGGNYSIRKVSADGKIERVAGTGEREDGPSGDALASPLKMPQGIFADKDGSVFVGDSEAHRIRVLRPDAKPAAVPVQAPDAKPSAAKPVSAAKAEMLAMNATGGDSLSKVSAAPGSMPAAVEGSAKGVAVAKAAPAAAPASPVAVEAVKKEAAPAQKTIQEESKPAVVAAVQPPQAKPEPPAAPRPELKTEKPGAVVTATASKPQREPTSLTEEPDLAAKKALEEARLKFEAEKEASLRKREEALAQKVSEVERRERALEKKQLELLQQADALRLREVQSKEAELSRREQDLKRRMADLEKAKAARLPGASQPQVIAPTQAAAPAPPAALSTQVVPKGAAQSSDAPPRFGESQAVAPVAENSLGMKFVPVGGVHFAATKTRVKDYEQFVADTHHSKTRWRSPGFEQTPDHPVVMVSWVDAVSFCKWLTDRERAAGRLKQGEVYRLPTDLEWSQAVGLPAEKGSTPEARDMGVKNHFPWGAQWPPPQGAGNYTGQESGADKVIAGYNDGFRYTSPVEAFPPNSKGLYDLGGNAWEWCSDTWNAKDRSRVLRGGSWYQGSMQLGLLSSCRIPAAPDREAGFIGFRVVRAPASKGR